MQHIHVKNLEKFNPGYQDRSLIWCKIYFTMLNSNYDFENIDDIDKWRFIAIVMLELQMKKPIPYDENWLMKKISNHKRPISLTIKMLHNFIELVTLDEESMYRRVEYSRVDKNIIRGFTKPSLDEVKTYVKENEYSIDSKGFIDFYDSKGWMVGKNKMKDWKAAVRGWHSRNNPTIKNEKVKKVDKPINWDLIE